MNHVFVSGNPALDFVGTLKWRRSAPEELLSAPADLSDWINASGLLTEPIDVGAADLERARVLREALYDVVSAKTVGRQLPLDALRSINSYAAAPPITPVLTPKTLVRDGSFSAVMSTLARSGIDVIAYSGDGSPSDSAMLKECGRDECTRIFLDRSRGHRRTWCGMDECGNRVNAAAYRRRRSADSDKATAVS